MNKIKKYKNGPEYYLLHGKDVEISSPFKSYVGSIDIAVELNLANFIDGYDYHDFPTSETLYFGKDDVLNAIEIFQELLSKIEEMENEK